MATEHLKINVGRVHNPTLMRVASKLSTVHLACCCRHTGYRVSQAPVRKDMHTSRGSIPVPLDCEAAGLSIRPAVCLKAYQILISDVA